MRQPVEDLAPDVTLPGLHDGDAGDLQTVGLAPRRQGRGAPPVQEDEVVADEGLRPVEELPPVDGDVAVDPAGRCVQRYTTRNETLPTTRPAR
ncbi:hypothetical protein GCM10027519_30730 [Kineococcus endophyticus]